MSLTPVNFIWHNGNWIPWQDAQVHVLSHALHYGTSVFEGIRAYETPLGVAIFRLDDHIKRLFESAHIYGFDVQVDHQEIMDACKDAVTKNDLKSAYIRPIIFYGYGGMGLLPPADAKAEVYVAAFPWGAYLGADSLKQGVDAGVSSWRRPAPGTIPTSAKAGGHYLSSRLIASEAKRLGYHEGIALDAAGYLSEGPGENLFLVRDNVLYTPSPAHALLPGLTRDTLMTLARQASFEVREQSIPREFLYLADELFFTGTAAEVVPIRSIDGKRVGSGEPGPVTRQLQDLFFGLFNGRTVDQWGWMDYVTHNSEVS